MHDDISPADWKAFKPLREAALEYGAAAHVAAAVHRSLRAKRSNLRHTFIRKRSEIASLRSQ
jgi:hypothetical protein